MSALIPFVLGLSFLSGLNLYLATFLAGLAVQLEWVDPSLLPALELLGHPVVMGIALVMLLVEFIVDKVPWIDSGWDAVHTVIRPVAAAALTAGVVHAAGMGTGGVTFLGIVAGGLALSTHLTKSGVRLLLNASPEPITNILASLGEDVLVAVMALWLIYAPFSGFAACLALLAVTWITLPKMFRLIRASLFLLWRKIFPRPQTGSLHSGALPRALTGAQLVQLGITHTTSAPIRWAVSCVSGKFRHIPGARSNRFGTLVSLTDQPAVLYFLTKSWFQRRVHRISLAGAEVLTDESWLSHQLVLQRSSDQMVAVFRFMKAEAPLVTRLASELHDCLGVQSPAALPAPSTMPAIPVPGDSLQPVSSTWGHAPGTVPQNQ